MADDIVISDANATQRQILTDELTTVNGADVSTATPRIHAQRVKIVVGVDGAADDASVTHPLPTSMGDGASITLGTTTDTDATGDGSVIGILKRIRTLLSGGFPAALGGSGGLKTEIVAALPTGNNNIGDVDIVTMPAANLSTDSIASAPMAETSLAGATPFKLVSAATTNATNVKSTVGKVYSIVVGNTNAAMRFLKFYNKASAPTVGTDTPVFVVPIPGNTAGAGAVVPLPMPLKFSTGIAIALTTGAADNDTGAVALNEITVSLGYI